MDLEHKFLDVPYDTVKDVEGIIEGYGSVFNDIDQVNECTDPGCFEASIKEANGEFPALWQHDYREPIGLHLCSEDLRGLKSVCNVDLDVQRARECLSLVKKRIVRGMSIGYYVQDDDFKDGVRHLKKVRLMEISYVTFPCLLSAQVSGAKAVPDEKVLESMVLRILEEKGMLKSAEAPKLELETALEGVLGVLGEKDALTPLEKAKASLMMEKIQPLMRDPVKEEWNELLQGLRTLRKI